MVILTVKLCTCHSGMERSGNVGKKWQETPCGVDYGIVNNLVLCRPLIFHCFIQYVQYGLENQLVLFDILHSPSSFSFLYPISPHVSSS